MVLIREAELTVFTIGFFTRTLEEFTNLLQAHNINLVIDIRSVPYSSCNPQFNKEIFSEHLKNYGIKYIHLGEIGGLRHPKPHGINIALEVKLRGYADYMQTRDFTNHLLNIIALGRENRLTLMCTEALPWRCLRNLISDALMARHVRVLHIINNENTIIHKLSEVAHVEGTKVSYPLFSKEKPQRTLVEF